jgi:hypothetical protein
MLPVPGLELRPLGRPARSQSLHRLSYHKPMKCVRRVTVPPGEGDRYTSRIFFKLYQWSCQNEMGEECSRNGSGVRKQAFGPVINAPKRRKEQQPSLSV